MSDPELIKALKRMGYRPMNNVIWGKPVGFHLFTIDLRKEPAEFVNNFKSMTTGKMLIWDTHEITDMRSIQAAEYSTHTRMYSFEQIDFGFLTPEQNCEELL